MALKFRKNQYVKLAAFGKAGKTPGIEIGDVIKILVVGPFHNGDQIVIEKTGHTFISGDTFDYFCEYMKFPDAYIALDEENLAPLV